MAAAVIHPYFNLPFQNLDENVEMSGKELLCHVWY